MIITSTIKLIGFCTCPLMAWLWVKLESGRLAVGQQVIPTIGQVQSTFQSTYKCLYTRHWDWRLSPSAPSGSFNMSAWTRSDSLQAEKGHVWARGKCCRKILLCMVETRFDVVCKISSEVLFNLSNLTFRDKSSIWDLIWDVTHSFKPDIPRQYYSVRFVCKPIIYMNSGYEHSQWHSLYSPIT